jgi:hypothetical protein
MNDIFRENFTEKTNGRKRGKGYKNLHFHKKCKKGGKLYGKRLKNLGGVLQF